jgi:hypothetical protein
MPTGSLLDIPSAAEAHLLAVLTHRFTAIHPPHVSLTVLRRRLVFPSSARSQGGHPPRGHSRDDIRSPEAVYDVTCVLLLRQPRCINARSVSQSRAASQWSVPHCWGGATPTRTLEAVRGAVSVEATPYRPRGHVRDGCASHKWPRTLSRTALIA